MLMRRGRKGKEKREKTRDSGARPKFRVIITPTTVSMARMARALGVHQKRYTNQHAIEHTLLLLLWGKVQGCRGVLVGDSGEEEERQKTGGESDGLSGAWPEPRRTVWRAKSNRIQNRGAQTEKPDRGERIVRWVGSSNLTLFWTEPVHEKTARQSGAMPLEGRQEKVTKIMCSARQCWTMV